MKKHLESLQKRRMVFLENDHYVKNVDDLSKLLQAHTCSNGKA
jgi:hypothetical protein